MSQSHQTRNQNPAFTLINFSLLDQKTVIYGFAAYVSLHINDALISKFHDRGIVLCGVILLV